MNKKQSELVSEVPSTSWNFTYFKMCLLRTVYFSLSSMLFEIMLFFSWRIFELMQRQTHSCREPPMLLLPSLRGDLPEPSLSPTPWAHSPLSYYFEADCINHIISSINISVCFSKRESIASLINKINL